MIDLLFRHLKQLWTDERGADLIEYALIAGIISAAGVAAFPSIAAKLDAGFKRWGQDVYDAWEPVDPK